MNSSKFDDRFQALADELSMSEMGAQSGRYEIRWRQIAGSLNWHWSANSELQPLCYCSGGGARLMLIDDVFAFARS